MTEIQKLAEQQENKSAQKAPEAAAVSGVIVGQSNQEIHDQAFAATHANDLRPSDPSLVATKDGETLEEYRARVAAIKNNPFVLVDSSAPGNGSAEDTGTVIDYQPHPIIEYQNQQIKDVKLVQGMDYEEDRDVRTPAEKLQDFVAAATKRATDPEGWKAWIQGEINKVIGISRGLNEAKEETKGAAKVAWKALTDGTVVNFLSQPNAINDPMFHAIGGAFDAMAKDPNAVNHVLEKLGTEMMEASRQYSALPDIEKGKVIGKFGFFMINPEGSTEGGQLALKISERVATHVDDAVMKTLQQAMKAAQEAGSSEVAQQTKQMLYDYLRNKGLSTLEFEAVGVPRGYFDNLPAAQNENVLYMKGDKGLPEGVKPSDKVTLSERLGPDGNAIFEIVVPEEVYKAAEVQGFERAIVDEKLEKLASSLARAYQRLGEYNPKIHGTERQYGTALHELLRQNIGKDSFLHTEESFLKGYSTTWGKLGSSRPDVVLGDKTNPFATICLKSLDAVPSAAQERGWVGNVPRLVNGSVLARLYLKLESRK